MVNRSTIFFVTVYVNVTCFFAISVCAFGSIAMYRLTTPPSAPTSRLSTLFWTCGFCGLSFVYCRANHASETLG